LSSEDFVSEVKMSFLTEIQIQPEAAEKIGTIVSSDRVTQKRISGKQVFCNYRDRASFYKKNTFGEGLPAVVFILFLPYGGGSL